MTQSPQLGNENASLTKLCVSCNQRYSATTTSCPQDNGELFDLKSDPMFGRRVAAGQFKVLRELGRGGMGAVYLAEDDEGKQVAIKLFKAQLTDRVSAAKFQQEAASWSRLQHPHSATLLSNVVDGKQPCLIVEFVHGKPLAQLLKQEGTLSPERCLHIFSQVMETIHYAHTNGVLHRDIKPGNIVLTNQNGDIDYVKVVDFMVENLSFGSPSNLGLADLVSRGPIYMSPEQCQGKKLTAASDIYSLGVSVYESLTGKPPFKGRNSVETASMQISVPPPPFATANPALSINSAIEQVTLRALEKDPHKRFASMAEFKTALTNAVKDPDNFVMPVSQPPAQTPGGDEPAVPEDDPAQALKVKKLPIALVAVAFIVAIIGIAFVVLSSGQKPPDSISFNKGPGGGSPPIVEGTVFYVSLEPVSTKPEGKTVEVRTGYRLSELCLRTSKGDLVKYGANMQRDLNYPGPNVGDRCRIAIDGSSIAKLKVLDADTNIKMARDTILDFVKAVANNSNKVNSLLSKDAQTKLGETLQKEWSGVTLSSDTGSENSLDSFAHDPLPQALKVLTADPQKIEILLNEDAVFKNQNAIDKFSLTPDDSGAWKINTIEKRVPRKSWLMYP